MTRLNLVLMLAVLLSAMATVQVQYESRRLYTEIERAEGEARRLDVDHERLQVEKREQSTPLRVERLAKDQLHMRLASPAITQYVDGPKGLPATGAAASRADAASPAQGASRDVASVGAR